LTVKSPAHWLSSHRHIDCL